MYLPIRIDMRLTDDHVLNVLRDKLGKEPGPITLREVAALARCSVQTAFNAIHRLEAAGRLRSQYQGTSKPCIYQVLD